MPRRKDHSVTGELVISRPDPAIVQEHPQDAPPGWTAIQAKLAASSGLSVLLVDGRQPPALLASNNNSICHAFQSSLDHVSLCDPYCGDAHRRAISKGSTVKYTCHAGLQCFSMPVQIGGKQNLAVIGGRAFPSGDDYRMLADRLRDGELRDLLNNEIFDNVIFADAERLDQLSNRVGDAVREFAPYAVTMPGDRTGDVSPAQPPGGSADTRVDAEPVSGVESEAELKLRRDVASVMMEMERRNQAVEFIAAIAENLNSYQPEETYEIILSYLKAGLMAERASLMVFDEFSKELTVKVARGLVCAEGEEIRLKLGEGIAGQVLESGEERVAEDMEMEGLYPAPPERYYKTKSFICFPIILKGRRLGVLNFADKEGGGKFSVVDLGFVKSLAPTIEDAFDRARLQAMSVTDPLTGLFNRRYLTLRLTEELNRASRHPQALSLLRIEMDGFDDRNTELTDNHALTLTAQRLKFALRAPDVPCHFGGKEFCVLLPQTDITGAGVIAERVRQLAIDLDTRFGSSEPLGLISTSIGVSTFSSRVNTIGKIMLAAYRALHRAKLKGRNRIEFDDESSA